MPSEEAPLVLEARNISKSFPGVRALQNVSINLRRGEVLAVVGENGAGKSTLMKILAGVYTPDEGQTLLEGQPVSIYSVSAAQRLGVVLIHQELNLATSLDVAGNIFLGREPSRFWPLKLISKSVYPQARKIMDRVGLQCNPRMRVEDMPVGQQQLVEIARALSLESRVLIMDEPTSSLTERETEQLFAVIDDLRRQGVSILYISHRLREIETIADRAVVLRDGKNAGELKKNEITHSALVSLMVGREMSRFFELEPDVAKAKAAHAQGAQALEVRNVRVFEKQSRSISFTIRPGEVVGMSGLMGAGRTELAEALFGIRPLLSGSVLVHGKPVRLRSPKSAISAGVYLIPEDRRLHGLVLDKSVQGNIGLPSLNSLSRAGLVRGKEQRELAEKMRERLRIRVSTVDQLAGLLSGGNQQKVVLGKWLAKDPRVLILDEPTRGIDVGAKAEIYALMHRLAGEGVAVLMISSDLEEILSVSDRVLVMHEGALAGALERSEMTEEAIMALATGAAALKFEAAPQT